MGNRVLMRVMTLKSVLGFGYNNVRDKTVGRLIEQGKHKLLIEAYYGLEKINFNQEVLDILGIKFTIDKPKRINNKTIKKILVKSALDSLPEDVLRFIEYRSELSKDRSKKYSKSINRDIYKKAFNKSILRNSNRK